MADFDLIAFFAQYAYQPTFVYLFIIGFMTASSFGLPIPEEMTLISAGLVGHMAMHPEVYTPPSPGATSVNLTLLAIICFIAVLGSDLLIYTLGKFFGPRITESKFFNKVIGQKNYKKINGLFDKYGHYACGLFRFTPGIRFPGHLSCGIMGVPLWKFLLVDGSAALISVPTQVLLVAYYGEVILEKIREFKMYLIVVLGIVAVCWVVYKLYQYFMKRKLSQN